MAARGEVTTPVVHAGSGSRQGSALPALPASFRECVPARGVLPVAGSAVKRSMQAASSWHIVPAARRRVTTYQGCL